MNCRWNPCSQQQGRWQILNLNLAAKYELCLEFYHSLSPHCFAPTKTAADGHEVAPWGQCSERRRMKITKDYPRNESLAQVNVHGRPEVSTWDWNRAKNIAREAPIKSWCAIKNGESLNIKTNESGFRGGQESRLKMQHKPLYDWTSNPTWRP